MGGEIELLPPTIVNQRSPAALAALLAASCAASVALAQPAAEWQPQLVALDESGNLNQPNFRFDSHHTAGGYWQITDTNWRQFAPLAGIDLARCPNALSCSFEEQGRVAGWMWDRLHYLPWVPTTRACAVISVPLAC